MFDGENQTYDFKKNANSATFEFLKEYKDQKVHLSGTAYQIQGDMWDVTITGIYAPQSTANQLTPALPYLQGSWSLLIPILLCLPFLLTKTRKFAVIPVSVAFIVLIALAPSDKILICRNCACFGKGTPIPGVVRNERLYWDDVDKRFCKKEEREKAVKDGVLPIKCSSHDWISISLKSKEKKPLWLTSEDDLTKHGPVIFKSEDDFYDFVFWHSIPTGRGMFGFSLDPDVSKLIREALKSKDKSYLILQENRKEITDLICVPFTDKEAYKGEADIKRLVEEAKSEG